MWGIKDVAFFRFRLAAIRVAGIEILLVFSVFFSFLKRCFARCFFAFSRVPFRFVLDLMTIAGVEVYFEVSLLILRSERVVFEWVVVNSGGREGGFINVVIFCLLASSQDGIAYKF